MDGGVQQPLPRIVDGKFELWGPVSLLAKHVAMHQGKHARGIHLMPGFSCTGRKQATRDDVVSVPSYSLINLGARYTPGGADGRVTLRLFADNITDKRYWKDTGASYGDTFLHLGAPTTVRFSAHYSF